MMQRNMPMGLLLAIYFTLSLATFLLWNRKDKNPMQ